MALVVRHARQVVACTPTPAARVCIVGTRRRRRRRRRHTRTLPLCLARSLARAHRHMTCLTGDTSFGRTCGMAPLLGAAQLVRIQRVQRAALAARTGGNVCGAGGGACGGRHCDGMGGVPHDACARNGAGGGATGHGGRHACARDKHEGAPTTCVRRPMALAHTSRMRHPWAQHTTARLQRVCHLATTCSRRRLCRARVSGPIRWRRGPQASSHPQPTMGRNTDTTSLPAAPEASWA